MTTDHPSAPNETHEEPEIRQEEAVPSDGKDTQGEKMMEDLGRDKPGRPLAPDAGDKK